MPKRAWRLWQSRLLPEVALPAVQSSMWHSGHSMNSRWPTGEPNTLNMRRLWTTHSVSTWTRLLIQPLSSHQWPRARLKSACWDKMKSTPFSMSISPHQLTSASMWTLKKLSYWQTTRIYRDNTASISSWSILTSKLKQLFQSMSNCLRASATKSIQTALVGTEIRKRKRV